MNIRRRAFPGAPAFCVGEPWGYGRVFFAFFGQKLMQYAKNAKNIQL
jgi:hypothetical protein